MTDPVHIKKEIAGECRVSVIVPNHNGAETIALCLEALLASHHDSYEIIVVDDCSSDNSVAIIKEYPCRLIRMDAHGGAAAARNLGARNSRGRTLFFTDSDCLVLPETLTLAEQAVLLAEPHTIIGGTYTCRPHDPGFFSLFQSVFIHYSELKNPENPDYIATHAMALDASTFRNSGGFREDFLPILEDVEFSHRLKQQGCRLRMRPEILVRHFFGFSLASSMANGYRKAKFWTRYSLLHKDLLTDSGTASFELKISVILFHVFALLAVGWLLMPDAIPPAALLVPLFINLLVCQGMLELFHATGGMKLALGAASYFTLLYPLAVGAGALTGIAFRGQTSS
ncbi:MAG: glycosyltransferase [Proteobacteria bacterium]|nr:glycosyltransferase [Pseudomonadota bacterium]MBU1736938.1 glycosyltransferase [Pseudomonadota bacterium]